MSGKVRIDPRQGNAGSLGDWLANPKNRAKMYRSDKADAADLARMAEEERQREAEPQTQPRTPKKL